MNMKATFQGNDAEAAAQFGEVQYGLAATVEVGDVAEGEAAQVYNVGTAQNARLNFVLPRGPRGEQGPQGAPGQDGADGAAGKAAAIRVGTVKGGDAPAVTNSGTDSDAVLDFTLPRGPQGLPGKDGTDGAPGKDGQQLWAAYVDESGHLIVQYEGAKAPPLRLDENGRLLYDANGQTVDLGLVKGADGAAGKDGIGVPAPGPDQAGKVPAVNAAGDGYELVPMGGGGAACIVWNVTVEEEVIAYTIPVDDPTAYDFYIYQVRRPSGWSGSLNVKFIRSSDNKVSADFVISNHEKDSGIMFVRPDDGIPWCLRVNYANLNAVLPSSAGGTWYGQTDKDPSIIVTKSDSSVIEAGTELVLRGYKFARI